jgi:hypothetical protein
VFNATFNNISVVSWWSVLLVEETGVPEKKPSVILNLIFINLDEFLNLYLTLILDPYDGWKASFQFHTMMSRKKPPPKNIKFKFQVLLVIAPHTKGVT